MTEAEAITEIAEGTSQRVFMEDIQILTEDLREKIIITTEEMMGNIRERITGITAKTVKNTMELRTDTGEICTGLISEVREVEMHCQTM